MHIYCIWYVPEAFISTRLPVKEDDREVSSSRVPAAWLTLIVIPIKHIYIYEVSMKQVKRHMYIRYTWVYRSQPYEAC